MLIEVKGLTVKFGGLVAVNGVDFDLRQGEILAIIGPNGAGKTTVFNLITGIYRPTFGTIAFKGKDVAHLPPYERVKTGISRTFQNIRLFKSLTVLENVFIGQERWATEGLWGGLLLQPSIKEERKKSISQALDYLKIVGLDAKMSELATSLSYGEQRLLEIARALAAKPDVLLLDEPAAGMNPAEKLKLKSLIKTLSCEMGKTILLIEHDMKVIMDISDRIIVLDHGEKIAEGQPHEIRSNRKVIDAYLGREETI